jgi:ribonuclease Z
VELSTLLGGYSKALYSTWVHYRPDRLLIDCGEGAASALGNGGYAIERVLLTHGHIDHIAGLPVLLWSRAGGMGDVHKPLHIYFPHGDPLVEQMRAYLHSARARWPFDLRWIPLSPGDTIPLDGTESSRHARHIECFPTRHIYNRQERNYSLTLGYRVVEVRQRLKNQFAQLPSQTLAHLSRTMGREHFLAEHMEDFRSPLWVWSGDSLPIDLEQPRGAEVLMHEATIIDEAERKHDTHSTLREAIALGTEAKVKTLVLYHFSGRYRAGEIRQQVSLVAEELKAEFPIWCLVRDRLFQAWPPGESGATAASPKRS